MPPKLSWRMVDGAQIKCSEECLFVSAARVMADTAGYTQNYLPSKYQHATKFMCEIEP